MDLFVSKYFNKIDKKGRVSLPSSFRNVLPKTNRNEIILYKSIKSTSIEVDLIDLYKIISFLLVFGRTFLKLDGRETLPFLSILLKYLDTNKSI